MSDIASLNPDPNVAYDLSLSEGELNEHLCRQSAILAFYGEAVEIKEAEVKRKKLFVEYFVGTQAAAIRNRYAAQLKKPTEAMIEYDLQADKEIYAHKMVLIDLELELGKLKSLHKSIAQKKDLIVSLANNLRQERQGLGNFRSVQPPTEGPLPIVYPGA